MRRTIDLASHLNADVVRGNPADFPVVLRPLYHGERDDPQAIDSRKAIVREDTGQAIAVVSNRYVLVPHTRILDIVEKAIQPLDVGPVPRGIYVDSQGARMRDIFKFPALSQKVAGDDDICPCLQVRNTYDGTARIALHIGAFRFVCTNLSVGGGGAFAGGFLSIHTGEIPIEKMAEELTSYLSRFASIVELYRAWSGIRPEPEQLEAILRRVLRGRFEELRESMLSRTPVTAFEAYNTLTFHATHKMRSARTAFDMLERVNDAFQRSFPAGNRESATSDHIDQSLVSLPA